MRFLKAEFLKRIIPVQRSQSDALPEAPNSKLWGRTDIRSLLWGRVEQ